MEDLTSPKDDVNINPFVEALDKNINNIPETSPLQETKRGRGRPKKLPPEPEPVRIIPQRQENKDFANLIKASANSFIKEPSIKLTDEEALALSAPYYQLYLYYMPFASGISGVWIDALIVTAGIGISKYQIAKELMRQERDNRKENHTDTGNTGGGEINKSEGINTETSKGDNI